MAVVKPYRVRRLTDSFSRWCAELAWMGHGYSQITVDDSAYMSAMIPHYAIAILTRENARIQDQRVRELADGILETQRREIADMNWLLEDIRANGIAATQGEADARPVPDS